MDPPSGAQNESRLIVRTSEQQEEQLKPQTAGVSSCCCKGWAASWVEVSFWKAFKWEAMVTLFPVDFLSTSTSMVKVCRASIETPSPLQHWDCCCGWCDQTKTKKQTKIKCEACHFRTLQLSRIAMQSISVLYLFRLDTPNRKLYLLGRLVQILSNICKTIS